MNRRDFLKVLGATTAAGLVLPRMALADVPEPYDWNATPPLGLDQGQAYLNWMVQHRGENPTYLAAHWDRYVRLVNNQDLTDDKTKRAFLLTPREEFVLQQNLSRAYDHAYLDIGYGVTISGPHLVGRMTQSIDVQRGDKVLEVGTGSGYQSAFLSNLTDQVWTIEIIAPLAARTRSIYDGLIARGYSEYRAISSKAADGYYGWEEAGPFDKIIVTCGIDHVPPPLLQQLRLGGIMVIPIGPPGAHHVLKITTSQAADGTVRVDRTDIYNGRIVPFVPFTKLEGDQIIGVH